MQEGSRDSDPAPMRIGRYAVHEAVARGGMATVFLGRLEGEAGFTRTVAIKRLHTHLAHDADFAAAFLDEARLCARIRHPNVVPTLDVIRTGDELCIVMEYVEGLSLSQLVRLRRAQFAPDLASAIIGGALRGLHAAHEATSDRGEPLGIVHRDVSPQNILVGADGVPRLIDFGVAKAFGNSSTTETGHVKGKLHYMSPEQLAGEVLDRRTDVFAAGTVLWELLTGVRLFPGESPAAVVRQLLDRTIPPPSELNPAVPKALDVVVLKALARDVGERFATAADFEGELEAAVTPAPTRAVAAFVTEAGAPELARRAEVLRSVESGSRAFKGIVAAAPTVPDGPAPDEGALGSQEVALSTSSSLRTSLPRQTRRRALVLAAGIGALVVAALAFSFTRGGAAPAGAPASAGARASASTPAEAPSRVAPVDASLLDLDGDPRGASSAAEASPAPPPHASTPRGAGAAPPAPRRPQIRPPRKSPSGAPSGSTGSESIYSRE